MQTEEEQRPTIWRGVVRPEWIDHNGHMNSGYYMVVFDESTGPWTAYCGIDQQYRESGQFSTFSIEGHITWERELSVDEPIRVEAQLLDYDDKKFHTFMRLVREEDGTVASSHELLTMHIDMRSRRSAAFSPTVLTRLAEVLADHSKFGRPEKVGRVMRTKGPDSAA